MSYIDKILTQIDEGKVEVKPGLIHMEVLHDDQCPMLKGTGPCECDPEIKVYIEQ